MCVSVDGTVLYHLHVGTMKKNGGKLKRFNIYIDLCAVLSIFHPRSSAEFGDKTILIYKII